MTGEKFTKIVNYQIDCCIKTLGFKESDYVPDPNDRMRHFKVAAAMLGTNPKQALCGMMAKHTASIYEMCRAGSAYPMAAWEEKITDNINYLLILRALLEDEKEERLHE
ncbi:MAG: hypothetical protein PHT58_03775 [Eubacteriales bacterium]|nr:hypothetical protein [Eubacteriales bacterium]